MPNVIRAIVNRNPDMKIVKAGSEIFGNEQKSDPNIITVEAIFQKTDVPNENGHYFSKSILMDAVNRSAERIANRGLQGELDHPNDIEDVIRLSTIELKNVSHVITKLEMDNNFLVGTFETAPTPVGIILSSLIKAKYQVGVSIRAITDDDINYDGGNVNHITAFDLITYDAVQNPAYKDAYVQSILSKTVFPIPHILAKNSMGAIKSKKNNEVLYTEDDVKEILNVFTRNFINNIAKNNK